jgi:hypothetical protein
MISNIFNNNDNRITTNRTNNDNRIKANHTNTNSEDGKEHIENFRHVNQG